MTWLKLDDRFMEHRKIRRLSDAAARLHITALCACAKDETDGLVTEADILDMEHGRRLRKYITTLIECGLWEPVAEGWIIHDYLEYNPSHADQTLRRNADRERQIVSRSPELRDAVRMRDQDRCRYCGVLVRWKDRRGPLGGTYDHVNPTGGTTVANLVVCCRGCNSSKGRRTPEEAGMALLTNLGPTQDVTRSASGLSMIPVPTRPDPSRPDPVLRGASLHGIDASVTREDSDDAMTEATP